MMDSTRSSKVPPKPLRPDFIERVRTLVLANETVDRALPGWGRLHIDRQLPFLFVYRRPRETEDPGTHRLIVGEASYLTSPPDRGLQKSVKTLTAEIAKVGVELFGGFLLVEVWAGEPAAPGAVRPDFRIHHPGLDELQSTVAAFAEELQAIRLHRRRRTVELVEGRRVGPPGRSQLIAPRIPGVYSLGIEALPVYRSTPTGEVYPLVLRDLHRQVSVAFKKASFRFVRALTTHRPKHFHALGRRAFVKAVWEVDRQLAEVGDSFDFLLSVSPVNTRKAWAAFQRNGYERTPRFRYPSLGYTPALVKRKLFAIPVERIEDPEVAFILRQKQDEIDRQLTGLADRGTFRFVHESVQLFGGAEPELVNLAKQILERTGGPSDDRPAGAGAVDADAFAVRAQVELDRFKQEHPRMTAAVQVRDDINGLMVSRGNLLIPRDLRIPAYRTNALIQHEVGTHVLTYFNGRAQPFRQFYLGLAGYDGLQEGLAVLSEFLVGGLTAARLKLLAARVVAVRSMLDGAGFVDVYRALTGEYGFSGRTAFTIATRVFRGGGLTKDAAYLRGLTEVLKYFRSGGSIEPLLVGKFGAEHLSLVQELLRRKALRPPPLRPGYLSDPDAMARLDAVKSGKVASVLDLLPGREHE